MHIFRQNIQNLMKVAGISIFSLKWLTSRRNNSGIEFMPRMHSPHSFYRVVPLSLIFSSFNTVVEWQFPVVNNRLELNSLRSDCQLKSFTAKLDPKIQYSKYVSGLLSSFQLGLRMNMLHLQLFDNWIRLMQFTWRQCDKESPVSNYISPLDSPYLT